MELIRQWFNGSRDYSVGVQLYLQYGHDNALKAFFQGGQTPIREQRLAEELKALVIGTVQLSAPETDLTPASYELTNNIGSDDPVVEDLYRQKAALHKQKDLLRHNLDNFPSDSERGAAAHQILRFRRQITAIWEKEIYYKQHGRLPEEEAGVTDPVALKHRRHIVNGNIRRLRSLLKKFPDHQGYKASLEKFQREYASLQTKIKKYKQLTHG